jgi:CheY-like chemotaxis protein
MEGVSGTEEADSSSSATTVEARYKILIVDDEKMVLEVVNEMISQEGHETTALSSPIEALQKAKRNKFDALVLDVYMPEMSGMLFHAKLKLFDPELAGRTVFISGYVSREELRQHLSHAPAFLEKPFKAKELVDALGRMLPPVPRQSS